MRFSLNYSSKTVVFSDVKTMQKFEVYHPAKQFSTVSFILMLLTLCGRSTRSRKVLQSAHAAAHPKPGYENARYCTITGLPALFLRFRLIMLIIIISLIEQTDNMQSYNIMKYELVNAFEEHSV